MKDKKNIKGGVHSIFMKKDINIHELINCIVISKAEKLAIYLYINNKKLTQDNIKKYLELTYNSFIICIKELLTDEYLKYKKIRNFYELGRIINILNDKYNNINFSNNGSETDLLYCIDKPNKSTFDILKHNCYYYKIIFNYNYYYNENKRKFQNKNYSINDFFKKIGFDIAIYFFIFCDTNYTINTFSGFSDTTKSKIEELFIKSYNNELKELSTEIVQTKINKLNDDYQLNTNNRLTEQQKYNLYKYSYIIFKHCKKEKNLFNFSNKKKIDYPDIVYYINNILLNFNDINTLENSINESPKITLSKTPNISEQQLVRYKTTSSSQKTSSDTSVRNTKIEILRESIDLDLNKKLTTILETASLKDISLYQVKQICMIITSKKTTIKNIKQSIPHIFEESNLNFLIILFTLLENSNNNIVIKKIILKLYNIQIIFKLLKDLIQQYNDLFLNFKFNNIIESNSIQTIFINFKKLVKQINYNLQQEVLSSSNDINKLKNILEFIQYYKVLINILIINIQHIKFQNKLFKNKIFLLLNNIIILINTLTTKILKSINKIIILDFKKYFFSFIEKLKIRESTDFKEKELIPELQENLKADLYGLTNLLNKLEIQHKVIISSYTPKSQYIIMTLTYARNNYIRYFISKDILLSIFELLINDYKKIDFFKSIEMLKTKNIKVSSEFKEQTSLLIEHSKINILKNLLNTYELFLRNSTDINQQKLLEQHNLYLEFIKLFCSNIESQQPVFKILQETYDKPILKIKKRTVSDQIYKIEPKSVLKKQAEILQSSSENIITKLTKLKKEKNKEISFTDILKYINIFYSKTENELKIKLLNTTDMILSPISNEELNLSIDKKSIVLSENDETVLSQNKEKLGQNLHDNMSYNTLLLFSGATATVGLLLLKYLRNRYN